MKKRSPGVRSSRAPTKKRNRAWVKEVPVSSGNDVLASVIKELDFDLKAQGTTVHAGSLPVFCVNSIHLEQLFRNLIGNAMKSKRPGVSGIIQISSQKNGIWCQVNVQDNGMGLSMEDEDQVFQVFYGLNRRRDSPQGQLELTICSRIVHHYGGKIWVVSREREGSRYCLTLPLLHPEKR